MDVNNDKNSNKFVYIAPFISKLIKAAPHIASFDSHSLLLMARGENHHWLHFMGKETEAQKSCIIC